MKTFSIAHRCSNLSVSWFSFSSRLALTDVVYVSIFSCLTWSLAGWSEMKKHSFTVSS